MKILHVHKFFSFEGGGGAGRYLQDLSDLLGRRGHENVFFSTKMPDNYATPYEKYFVKGFSYQTFGSLKPLEKVRVFCNGIYSREAKRKIRWLVRDARPDIAHIYNVFYQLSPSVLHSLKAERVPIVLSLLDCQMLCASASFRRKEGDCQQCKDSYIGILRHRCLKDSVLGSVMAFCAKVLHDLLRIWDNVDLFVTASRAAKEIFVQWGFEESKIVVNPYFTDVDHVSPSYDFQDYCLFVGRLTFEKGVDVLLRAFQDIDARLVIIGDGPARQWMEGYVAEHSMRNIRFVGSVESKAELYEYLRRSMFTVVPSSWYELFPLIALNSFCAGKPVVGSDSGGIPEIVDPGENGLLFPRGDSDGLREAVQQLVHNKDLLVKYGQQARRKAELDYAPDKHYARMMAAYERALQGR